MGEVVDRRTALRRGAIVGAAVWITPTLRSIPAAATEATSAEPTGGGPPPTRRWAITYAALVVNCGGTSYRVLYSGDGWVRRPGSSMGKGRPTSCKPATWDSATPADGSDLGIVVTKVRPDRWRVLVPMSCGDDAGPVEGASATAGGGDAQECTGPVAQRWTDDGYEIILQS